MNVSAIRRSKLFSDEEFFNSLDVISLFFLFWNIIQPIYLISGRCKREVEPTLFPYPGTWYKDSESGKFYYHLGNTVYVERSDKYYTIWVTSGDGADWAQNDNYVWKWDENGRWYPHKGEKISTSMIIIDSVNSSMKYYF